MNIRRKLTTAAVAAAVPLGLTLAFAGPAGATTGACAAAYGNQCGTFAASASDAATPPGTGNTGGLAFDVKGQRSAPNTPLINYPNFSPSGTDPATDFTKVEHNGPVPGAPTTSAAIWYTIVYTPNGKWTSMCLANPMGGGGVAANSTALVLRPCNKKVWQAFEASTPPGSTVPAFIANGGNASKQYALKSMANGLFVAAGGLKGTPIAADAATATAGNSWYWVNSSGT